MAEASNLPANYSDLSETKMDQDQVEHLNYVLRQMGDPVGGAETFDDFRWRKKVVPKMLDGDINAMKQAAAPFVEHEMIRIAIEGKTEQARIAAGQFVLGQAGHGVVQKHEHSIPLEQLPPNQLIPIIVSKLQRLQKLNPRFSLGDILQSASIPQEVVDAVEAQTRTIETSVVMDEDHSEESFAEDAGGEAGDSSEETDVME